MVAPVISCKVMKIVGLKSRVKIMKLILKAEAMKIVKPHLKAETTKPTLKQETMILNQNTPRTRGMQFHLRFRETV